MVAAAGLATPLGTDPDFAPAHVAAGLPRHRRVGYLRAASAILDENGGTTGPERNALRRLAAALALPEASSAGVDEGRTDVENRDVDEIVRSFHQDPFRYALLKDMLLMVYAGGRLTVGRVERLANFAEFLGVPTAHMVLLSRYVEERLSPDPRPHGETEFFRVLAGGLEAAARRARSRAGIWSWFVGPKAGREIRRPKEE